MQTYNFMLEILDVQNKRITCLFWRYFIYILQ